VRQEIVHVASRSTCGLPPEFRFQGQKKKVEPSSTFIRVLAVGYGAVVHACWALSYSG
jgi:hypothetical protein